MPDADDTLAHATDTLIGLYRGVERRTLDLPWLSAMPALLFIWAFMRFYFFFVVGIFLIIPVNLVIFIRNRIPGGHWRYRPFFLSHIYYILLWLWRGEAPTAPLIFVRPLLNVFMKMHFERRLRRLRLEIVLRDALSDAERATLLARVDAALERWKAPRFTALFFTALVPAIISFPSWYKNSNDVLTSLGFLVTPNDAVGFVAQYISPEGLRFFGLSALVYLLGVPVTAFLAKRGLFMGRDADRIYFPGGQAGCGIYAQEREILHGVGIRGREVAIDLWIMGLLGCVNLLFLKVITKGSLDMMAKFQTQSTWTEGGLLAWQAGNALTIICLIVFVAIRRIKTGRD